MIEQIQDFVSEQTAAITRLVRHVPLPGGIKFMGRTYVIVHRYRRPLSSTDFP